MHVACVSISARQGCSRYKTAFQTPEPVFPQGSLLPAFVNKDLLEHGHAYSFMSSIAPFMSSSKVK
jgi:hypothetical protein